MTVGWRDGGWMRLLVGLELSGTDSAFCACQGEL
jgi:hypothetical protein